MIRLARRAQVELPLQRRKSGGVMTRRLPHKTGSKRAQASSALTSQKASVVKSTYSGCGPIGLDWPRLSASAWFAQLASYSVSGL